MPDSYIDFLSSLLCASSSLSGRFTACAQLWSMRGGRSAAGALARAAYGAADRARSATCVEHAGGGGVCIAGGFATGPHRDESKRSAQASGVVTGDCDGASPVAGRGRDFGGSI